MFVTKLNVIDVCHVVANKTREVNNDDDMVWWHVYDDMARDMDDDIIDDVVCDITNDVKNDSPF